MMKKRIAMIMAAAMITGVSATTAFAEGPSLDGVPQMGGPQIPGGNENGQAPSDNGQQAPQGETPSDIGQQAPQGEAPSDNGQQAPQGEAPSDNGQQAPQGEVPKDGFGFVPFEEYVKDGTISQETYDAITKYMDENKPELPEGAEEGERPELPNGAEEGERPELPDGAAEGSMPKMKEGEGPDLLNDLLSAGVITQEEYDALVAKREASASMASSDNQDGDEAQTGSSDEAP